MTSHVNLPHIVAADGAPDNVQHMATDINDVINRLNAVITDLSARVAVLEANAAIHGVGAYGY